jgi:isopropylmalate/homocitrate/citramalate synthase
MLITSIGELKKSLICNIKSFGLLCSVSDSFAKSNLKKNANKSFEEMMEQYSYIVDNNKYKDYHIRFYLSCSFGTLLEDYDYEYMYQLTKYISTLYKKIRSDNLNHNNIDIVLCDTMGLLTESLLIIILDEITKNNELKDIEKYISLHLHTTKNFHSYIDIALTYKINKFDSSILNIGGCPFSGKDNYGNINTLELVKYLEQNNYDTNIDYHKLENIEKDISKILNE